MIPFRMDMKLIYLISILELLDFSINNLSENNLLWKKAEGMMVTMKKINLTS